MNLKKLSLVALACLSMAACSKVEPGHVGVMVNTLGDDKGVEDRPLSVGRYWTGWNKELYQFPIYTQIKKWTKADNEEIHFQSKEGIIVTGEFAITYHIEPDKVTKIFQTYRNGNVDEITDGPIHNAVRGYLEDIASDLTSEEIYSSKKIWLMNQVVEAARKQFGPIGIIVESITALGPFDLPAAITDAINSKVIASQVAEAKKNQIVAETQQQEINRVKAEGEAAAEIAKANGSAQANQIISRSLTPELIQFQMMQKWDGHLPQVSSNGGFSTLMQLPTR